MVDSKLYAQPEFNVQWSGLRWVLECHSEGATKRLRVNLNTARQGSFCHVAATLPTIRNFTLYACIPSHPTEEIGQNEEYIIDK